MEIKEIDNGVDFNDLPPMRDSAYEEYTFIANENLLVGRGSVGQLNSAPTPGLGEFNRRSLAQTEGKRDSEAVRKNLNFYEDVVSPTKPEIQKMLQESVADNSERKVGKMKDLNEISPARKIVIRADPRAELDTVKATTMGRKFETEVYFSDKKSPATKTESPENQLE
jgi:hypothetical protein